MYRGTSLNKERLLLGPYSRTMSKAIWRSCGGGRFLMSEVPLYVSVKRPASQFTPQDLGFRVWGSKWRAARVCDADCSIWCPAFLGPGWGTQGVRAFRGTSLIRNSPFSLDHHRALA